eukprot:TRINITY_DN4883_c0_g1_i1.p1 TRINITY_DN4883_c0_g1~~TRINITY_DN4883_c0_g1_i1.p1  ORF type:complete len:229 (-),score=25.38 TRINITY_DN4883_c0_g1_i1:302-988(-)
MVVPQPSVIADGGSLQHQFATKLRQVALEAGPAGVLLSKLPSMVTIADRKLNNSECQLFGCDSLKSFIDSQPMLRRTGTSGLMRCIHKSYDSVIAAHRDGKPAFESRATGLTAAGAAVAPPLPEPLQQFVHAIAATTPRQRSAAVCPAIRNGVLLLRTIGQQLDARLQCLRRSGTASSFLDVVGVRSCTRAHYVCARSHYICHVGTHNTLMWLQWVIALFDQLVRIYT